MLSNERAGEIKRPQAPGPPISYNDRISRNISPKTMEAVTPIEGIAQANQMMLATAREYCKLSNPSEVPTP